MGESVSILLVTPAKAGAQEQVTKRLPLGSRLRGKDD
jgi:hypothetical protein